MLRKVRKKIDEFHMVSEDDKVLVGVSGGADSVCLLLVLLELKKQMNFSIEVVHVEHGIRGEESLKDAEFVEKLCQRMQIVCHRENIDVPAYARQRGLGIEEAARILRYQIFSRLALEKGAKIALAHHQEDNAETILFQMVRGSSLSGLCGMQPVRIDDSGICYIRPLLFLHRLEIENYLETNQIEYCVDSTNAELEYSRNFLRAQVLPDLMQINEQAVEHINNSAAHLSEMKDYLDKEIEKVWAQVAEVEDKVVLKLDELLQLHRVMQRQIVYKAIELVANCKKDISSVHVDNILALCVGQSGKRISLPYGIVVWKEFDRVYVSTLSQTKQNTEYSDKVYKVSSELLGTLLEDAERGEATVLATFGGMEEKVLGRILKKESESLEIPRKTCTKWFDYDMIKQGFCIRTRRSGDYFISDALGHRKKLKEYFIDEKIPLAEREKRWLLAKDNEVLWVIGGRISEHVKVSQKTKYILEITYDGGNRDE